MRAAPRAAPDVIDGESLFDEGGIIANPLIATVTQTEEELRTLVAKALPHSEAERVSNVAAALLCENLTVATLHETTSAGGSMLLFAALDIDGLALRRGDRLSLVSAVLEGSASAL